MKTCYLRKGPLIKAMKIISLPGVEKFFFRPGTISAKYGNHLFASARTDIRLITGSIDAWRFHDGIKLFKSDYFDMGVTSKGLTFEPDENTEIEIYYDPATENFPQIDLWDPEIQWHRCPGDLIEGINQVGASSGQEVYEEIYVLGRYVIGFTKYEACRYRLDFLSPFDMTFDWVQIKKTLKRFKELKLLRAAKYSFEDADKLNSGIAFDFDDIRIWVSEADCPGPDEEGYRPKPDFNNIHSLFLRPAQFFVELTEEVIDELYNTYVSLEVDSEMVLVKIRTLKKGKVELQIDWKNSYGSGTDKIPVRVYGPLKAVSFILNFTNLFSAIKGKCLMGYTGKSKELMPKSMIYLKEARRETMMGVSGYKQRKRRIKK